MMASVRGDGAPAAATDNWIQVQLKDDTNVEVVEQVFMTSESANEASDRLQAIGLMK